MGKQRIPNTSAIRALRALGVPFTPLSYRYEERGGTRVAARELGVDEHLTIKTLVMQDEKARPFLVLMHGDQEVSTKSMARILNVKHVEPCDSRTANRHTGYQVGGISPFGTRRVLPVYMQASIANLAVLYINAGKRGLLVKMTPADLIRALQPLAVEAAAD